MRIAGLVLAAGRSSRMTPRNKLLEPVGGEKMVRRVATVAMASGAKPVIVVTGHEAAAVAAALRGLAVTIVVNPAYADGLSTSLRDIFESPIFNRYKRDGSRLPASMCVTR